MLRLLITATATTLLSLPIHTFAAPTAPVLQRDSRPGCQATSFGPDFHWTVSDFDYHASYVFSTPAHQNSWGHVTFGLSNPALSGNMGGPAATASCAATSNQLSDFFYGTVRYRCDAPADHPDGNGTETSFTFNRPAGRLDVEQTWVCSDQDPRYPVTITSYGTVNLTLACSDKTWTDPDWELGSGELYSDREVKCDKITVPMSRYEVRAVA